MQDMPQKLDFLYGRVSGAASLAMHSIASASTIAWLFHQSFGLGIPLYARKRNERLWDFPWARQRCRISFLWFIANSFPMWFLISEGNFWNRSLHINETHLQVLKESERKNTSDFYMWWVYCSIRDCKWLVRYFEYQPGRGEKYPEVFLKAIPDISIRMFISGTMAWIKLQDACTTSICAAFL